MTANKKLTPKEKEVLSAALNEWESCVGDTGETSAYVHMEGELEAIDRIRTKLNLT